MLWMREGELWFLLIVILAVGAGIGIAGLKGCAYVRDHVEVQWKGKP